jgi:serine/threonine protein kinase
MRQIVRGQYKDIKTIGRGGFGQVVEVVDPQGKHYALKELLPEYRDEADMVARFRREIRVLRGLLQNKVGIVRFVDGSLDLENPYLVMPIAIKSLYDVLDEASLPEEVAAIWFLQILAGVETAHARRLIHRDLKPANILLFPTKEAQTQNNARNLDKSQSYKLHELQAVVSDFGLGALSLAGTTKRHSKGGGTWGYMPPEAFDGNVQPTPAFDVFALGKILYLMLAPADAKPSVDNLSLDLVPEAFRKLIADMCKPEREERISTIERVRVGFLDAWSKRGNAQHLLDQAERVVTGGDRRGLDSSIRYKDAVALLIVDLSRSMQNPERIAKSLSLIKASIDRLGDVDQLALLQLLTALAKVSNTSGDDTVKRDIVEIFVDLGLILASGPAHLACWKFVADSALKNPESVGQVAKYEFEMFCLKAENRDADLTVVKSVLGAKSKTSEFWCARLKSTKDIPKALAALLAACC